MVNYSSSELKLLSFFSPGTRFCYNGLDFIVEFSGKPYTRSGEPKTDVYVLIREFNNIQNKLELKISYKKSNADFLENKMNEIRAFQIFGADWQNRIANFTSSISSSLNSRPYIFKEKYRRIQAGSITLGWKFELLNKTGGDLSGKIDLTYSEVLEVYSGRNMSDDKRHSYVNGSMVPNSGVANYVLHNDIDLFNTTQSVVNSLIEVENFVSLNPNIYFACKALNYRSFHEKYDGNRPLSVFINWKIDSHRRLHPQIVYSSPLLVKGDEVATNLKKVLNDLGISTTDDICSFNVSNPSIIFDNN